ncbi:MAG: hypothetical protein LBS62_05350, partial [Clostridiales bacterium]|nr:hypothetical protein [Clostridiales bacterium]
DYLYGLLSDDRSRDLLSKIVRLKFALMFMPYSIALKKYGVHPPEHWAKLNKKYEENKNDYLSWFKSFGNWQIGTGIDLHYL